ncbi:putative uncharacterized protein DDB_G0282133 [Bicyclus anynana]|uniref:Hyaluronidase n=1 Tax=Bicyclus anynana TaxID=110368 RepID=A0A6J1NZZ1_BICAN|nr:putative uncharacterized protein DDB_G0282133 [Bicyclus anynana]
MLLLTVFVLVFCSVRCGYVGENYIIDKPDYDAPTAEDTPFKVYWNVPTKQCRSRGIPFDNLLKKFTITYNKNDRFEGETITIIYNVGIVPSILKSNGAKFSVLNGGVPQEGNLEEHLAAFRETVVRLIPDPDFKGIGVLDLEQWRPIYRQHWGTQASNIDLSLSIEMRKYWWWPTKWQKLEAEKRFEDAARKFMETTLYTAKQMRPKAAWGYYGFPYCFNMDKNNRNEQCAKYVNAENDRIYWLWAESTALYPSLYSESCLTTSELEKLVSGRLTEANRVKGSDDLVLPYFALTYRDGPFIKESDVVATFNVLQKKNASGIVIWGASNDVNTADKCNHLYEYVETIFGPIAQKYIQRINKKRQDESNKRQLNTDNYKSDNTSKSANVTFNHLTSSNNTNNTNVLFTENSTQNNNESLSIQSTTNSAYPATTTSYQQRNKYYYEVDGNKTEFNSFNESDFWSIIPFNKTDTGKVNPTVDNSTHDKDALITFEIVENTSSPKYETKNNVTEDNSQLVKQEKSTQITMTLKTQAINRRENVSENFMTLSANLTRSHTLLNESHEENDKTVIYKNVTGKYIETLKSPSSLEFSLLSSTTGSKDISPDKITTNSTNLSTETKENGVENYLITSAVDFTTPNYRLLNSNDSKISVLQDLNEDNLFTRNSTYFSTEKSITKENNENDYLITLKIDITSSNNTSTNEYDTKINVENIKPAGNLDFMFILPNHTLNDIQDVKQEAQNTTYPNVNTIDRVESDDSDNLIVLANFKPNKTEMNSKEHDTEIDIENIKSGSDLQFISPSTTNEPKDSSQYENEDELMTTNFTYTSNEALEREKNAIEDYLVKNTEDFTTPFNTSLVFTKPKPPPPNNVSIDLQKLIQEDKTIQNTSDINTNSIDTRESNIPDNFITINFTCSASVLTKDNGTEIDVDTTKSASSLEVSLLPPNNNSNDISKDISQYENEDELRTSNFTYTSTEALEREENAIVDYLVTNTEDFTTPFNTSLKTNESEINFKYIAGNLEFTGLPSNNVSIDLQKLIQEDKTIQNTSYINKNSIDTRESNISDNLSTIDFTSFDNVLTKENDTEIDVDTTNSASSLEFSSLPTNNNSSDISQYIKQHNSSYFSIEASENRENGEHDNLITFAADLTNIKNKTLNKNDTEINFENVESSSTLQFLLQNLTPDELFTTYPTADEIKSEKSDAHNVLLQHNTEIDLTLQPEQKLKNYYYDADYNKAEHKSSNNNDYWNIIPFEETTAEDVGYNINASSNDNDTKTTYEVQQQ